MYEKNSENKYEKEEGSENMVCLSSDNYFGTLYTIYIMI
jgi:hypothetical protein